jgi:hypothetical protein
MPSTLLDVFILIDLDVTFLKESPQPPIQSSLIKSPPQVSTISVAGELICQHIKRSRTQLLRGSMHIAFLMMWLEQIVFCGPTLDPFSNMQCLPELLERGDPIHLTQYLLGATYHMPHQAVRSLGGHWW